MSADPIYGGYLKQFSRKYFEEADFGGYVLYRDYPCHWKTAQVVLDRKPTSAVELGAAYGFVVKRLKDAGVPTVGVDVSNHCAHRRITNDIVIADATEELNHWAPSKYDLVYSVAFLELVPPERVPMLKTGMERVAKRGLHGVSFGNDKWKRDRAWWKEHLPADHEILEKDEMEAPPFPIPQGDGTVKLNVGSFINMFHYGWVNIDIVDVRDYALQSGYVYSHRDATQGFDYPDGSVSLVYATHFLEHLSYQQGAAFLKECYRVLRPGGVVRIGVPDTGLLTKMYVDDPTQLSLYDEINAGCARAKTSAEKLCEVLWGGGHQAVYDEETLSSAVSSAGFRVETSEFGKSVSLQMQKETFDVLPTLSLYIDGVKT